MQPSPCVWVLRNGTSSSVVDSYRRQEPLPSSEISDYGKECRLGALVSAQDVRAPAHPEFSQRSLVWLETSSRISASYSCHKHHGLRHTGPED